MPLELCKKCGGFHYSRDPCPIRSTGTTEGRGNELMKSEPLEASAVRPVEADLPSCEPAGRGRAPRKQDVATLPEKPVLKPGPVDLINAGTIKRGRGRPQTIFDMKAYKADKERRRRAAAKEGK